MLPVLKEYQVKDNLLIHIGLFYLSFESIFLIYITICSVVEQVTGRDHVLNHLSIPAACFTHPEISMVGLTEVLQPSFLPLDVFSN